MVMAEVTSSFDAQRYIFGLLLRKHGSRFEIVYFLSFIFLTFLDIHFQPQLNEWSADTTRLKDDYRSHQHLIPLWTVGLTVKHAPNNTKSEGRIVM